MFTKKHDFVGIAVAIIFILAITIVVASAFFDIINETNHITEGVIVDKRIVSGRDYASNNGKNFYYDSYDTTYNFCLSGKKDGKDVTYWVAVSEEDYNNYKVGDYYHI